MSRYEIVDADKSTRPIPVSIALAGGAGSGKTWTALMIATELAEGGKVGMVDTENGFGLEYRKKFTYRYLPLDAPFSPLRYEEAIKALIDDGCKAIVVDSGSHAWEGDGGTKDCVDTYCQQQAQKWSGNPDKYTAPAWGKFRPIHRHMIHFASSNSVPTVWCFRAREKTKVETVEKEVRGKIKKTIEFVPLGWQPITSDLSSFDVSAFFMLEPVLETGCKPGTILRMKVRDTLANLFQIGHQITKDDAKAIARYAKTELAPPKPATGTPQRAPAASEAPPTADAHQALPWTSEGEQQGIPDLVEDDPDQLELTDEEAVQRARQLYKQIGGINTMAKIRDYDSMITDLKPRLPADSFAKLAAHLQAKSHEINAAERAA